MKLYIFYFGTIDVLDMVLEYPLRETVHQVVILYNGINFYCIIHVYRKLQLALMPK